jgi:hypothetical protein
MPKQVGPSALIKKMSRETLESILLEHVREDATLGRRILMKYGTSTTVEHYKSLVDDMLEGLQDRNYDRYSEDDAYGAALEIDKLFDKAKKKSVTERSRSIFEVAQAVIEGLIPSLDECDDHDGNLYRTVDETFERIAKTAKARGTDPAVLADISKWAEALVSSNRLGSWRGDWAKDCIVIAASAARSENRLREILALCDSLLREENENSNSTYFVEEIAIIELELLGRCKAKAERKAFVDGHLDFDKVRELAIREAIKTKDFKRGKALAAEGISKATQNKRSGDIDNYRGLLVEAMDAEGTGPDANMLVERWAIEENYDSWFKALKAHISKSKWNETRDRVLKAIESKSDRSRLLASLYASERLFDKLMELCEKNPREFIEYYHKLMKAYPGRVAPLLRDHICRKAASDSNRSSYSETASLVADYRKCAGDAATASLIDELEARHRSRPAMREELEKVRPR